MTSPTISDCRALRRNIETCELPHTAFMAHLNALSARIDDALDGFTARLDALVGPTRVGKTMLINALRRKYPEAKRNGGRMVPVLVVPIPSNISPLLLPSSVLKALGVPIPTRSISSGMMFERMCDQLRLAQTRVLLFEEASHLVEPGAKLPHRAAGDWFKSLMDELNMTLILFGVPRLHKLFVSNEQLRARASATREFRPYDSSESAQMRSFAMCVKTYADLFAKSGWPIDMPLENLTKHCYLLSGGLVGLLSRFMQELSCQLIHEASRPLTFEDCRLAARSIECFGHPDFPAFTNTDVSIIELRQSHAHTLELNDMSVARIPHLAEAH